MSLSNILEEGDCELNTSKYIKPISYLSSLIKTKNYRLEYWQYQREDIEIWILKKDVYYFVLCAWLARAGPSPYGFLLDVQQDLIVRRMLKTTALGTPLDMATLWWPRFPQEILTHGNRTRFQRGL